MLEQPRIRACERPVAQAAVCISSTPALESPNGDLVVLERPHSTHRPLPVQIQASLALAQAISVPICRRQFTSKGTLSQHRRRAHPTKYNADCLARLPTSRYNWSQLEDALLIKYADELSSSISMLEDLYEAISLRLGNQSNGSIKKRLQLLRLGRPKTASALQPTALTPQVPENASPLAETPDIAIPDNPTTPLSPVIETTPSASPTVRDVEHYDRTPTLNTTFDRSTSTIHTPRGSDRLEESSLGVEWLNPIVFPGNFNLFTPWKGPSSRRSDARSVNLRNFTSGLLPVDLDWSDETATPQTPQTTFNDENHSESEEHRSTSAYPQTQPDVVPVDTFSVLSEESQRALSNDTNRDAASSHLLAIVDDRLHQPTNLESFQVALEKFCRKWYPHRWVRKRKRSMVLSCLTNCRQRRRLQYGHMQNLFRRYRKDAVSTALDGRWREAFASLNGRVEDLNPC
ncbi:hypothetical protein EG68_11286 [Paragonimus skrjabini miyazakii]|uniref:Uncharacterized protein n=1 Tax=Paragonimus skrjabini miyazakii TaxID=59628 RepID=A0A8S9YDZ9_9TREM|nr:hypothetical protein EG68_11286 [Paragonimus skrjabini miyazakii]